MQRRLAAQRLNVVQLMMARGRPVLDYERMLLAAQAPEVLWQASATLGEVRFGERRFVEAAQAYDLAIEIIKNETLTPLAPSKFDIEGLIERSARRAFLPPMALDLPVVRSSLRLQKINAMGRLGEFIHALYGASFLTRYRSPSPSSLARRTLPMLDRMQRANCLGRYRNRNRHASFSSDIPMYAALRNST